MMRKKRTNSIVLSFTPTEDMYDLKICCTILDDLYDLIDFRGHHANQCRLNMKGLGWTAVKSTASRDLSRLSVQ